MTDHWWDGETGPGRLHLVVALVLGVGSAVATVLMQLDAATPGLQVVTSRADVVAFSSGTLLSTASALALAAVTSAFIGFAYLVLPPPVRPARAALALFVAGTVVMVAGLARGHDGEFGWFAYAPLPAEMPEPAGQTLIRVGHVVAGIGVVWAASLLLVGWVVGWARRRPPGPLAVVMAASAGLIAVLTLARLPELPREPGLLAGAALALPFVALLLDAVVAGPGVARGFAAGGLVTVAIGLATRWWTAHANGPAAVGWGSMLLLAVVLFGSFAGLYRRWPLIFGQDVNEVAGWVHAGLLFVGCQVALAAAVLQAHQGMPRRYADYLPGQGFTGDHRLATVGAAVLVLSVLPLAAAIRRRAPAD